MNQENETEADEMRPEYDIRGGVRGKYYERYREGTNVVLLQPDCAAVFRSSEAVNREKADRSCRARGFGQASQDVRSAIYLTYYLRSANTCSRIGRGRCRLHRQKRFP